MTKPAPVVETKSVMNLIDMCEHIDKKYVINQRDYKNAHGFNWVEYLACNGVDTERANRLYRTAPVELTDEDKVPWQQAHDASEAWRKERPYCDFWHFQLDLMPELRNDSYQYYPLMDALEMAEEPWQKEIAQLWVDEFGEFADKDGCIYVRVSW